MDLEVIWQRASRAVYSGKEHTRSDASDRRRHLISPTSVGVDDQSSITLLSPKTEFLARNLWIVFFEIFMIHEVKRLEQLNN